MNPFELLRDVFIFAVTQIVNRIILWIAVAFIFFIVTPDALPNFASAVWMIFVGGDGPFALFGLAKYIYGILSIAYIALMIYERMILNDLTEQTKADVTPDPSLPTPTPIKKSDIKKLRKEAMKAHYSKLGILTPKQELDKKYEEQVASDLAQIYDQLTPPTK